MALTMKKKKKQTATTTMKGGKKSEHEANGRLLQISCARSKQ